MSIEGRRVLALMWLVRAIVSAPVFAEALPELEDEGETGELQADRTEAANTILIVTNVEKEGRMKNPPTL
jgi:hypothetical protein